MGLKVWEWLIGAVLAIFFASVGAFIGVGVVFMAREVL